MRRSHSKKSNRSERSEECTHNCNGYPPRYLIILLLEQIIMTIIIQPTAQKTRFSQKNYEQTKQNDPIGKISLRYNPRSSHASKKSKLENMSEKYS